MSNYHPLEVVGGASETQLKMGEKLNLAGTMGYKQRMKTIVGLCYS